MQKWNRLELAYVGVDVHKQQHTAVVLDCFGDRLGATHLVNRAAAFPGWLAEVQALAPGKRLIFGLENTSTWWRWTGRHDSVTMPPCSDKKPEPGAPPHKRLLPS